MTTFRILFGLLCLFHVGALFLNASNAQKTVPHRWKSYLPGWAIAAAASIVVVTMPNSPLSGFWQTWLRAVSAQAQSLLMGIYFLSLTACLALVFFRTPNPRGAPRSFIAFGLRLLFGRGTDRETAQLIESGEYAIVGACGLQSCCPRSSPTVGSAPTSWLSTLSQLRSWRHCARCSYLKLSAALRETVNSKVPAPSLQIFPALTLAIVLCRWAFAARIFGRHLGRAAYLTYRHAVRSSLRFYVAASVFGIIMGPLAARFDLAPPGIPLAEFLLGLVGIGTVGLPPSFLLVGGSTSGTIEALMEDSQSSPTRPNRPYDAVARRE